MTDKKRDIRDLIERTDLAKHCYLTHREHLVATMIQSGRTYADIARSGAPKRLTGRGDLSPSAISQIANRVYRKVQARTMRSL